MKVIVIGAGAAGMMAALVAANGGNEVTLLEKNNKPGKKLFLTGKGRCNLTNSCDTEELFNNVVTNPKFLFSAFYDFTNADAIAFFEDLGLRLKKERGNRIFPLSDHSSDVIKTLEKALIKTGVFIRYDSEVTALLTKPASSENNEKKKTKYHSIITGVTLKDGSNLFGDAVIMATGGASYPSTGSDGRSFDIIKTLGIDMVSLKPALVPLTVKEDYVFKMSGLTLKNVAIRVVCGDKEIFSDFGEMLFTHFGVSGPLILSASSYLNGRHYKEPAMLYIDLKPALTLDELDERILRDFSENRNKQFKNSLSNLLPAGLIPSVVMLSGISPDKQVNSVTREEREKLSKALKNYPLTISGDRGFDEAIITSGGISVKEINPSTMECKKVKGLYFAGEMIDVDARTGGFNLQIAWSSAHLAGRLGG